MQLGEANVKAICFLTSVIDQCQKWYISIKFLLCLLLHSETYLSQITATSRRLYSLTRHQVCSGWGRFSKAGSSFTLEFAIWQVLKWGTMPYLRCGPETSDG